MRLIKMLGLTIVAAIAAMAFIGVGSAAAELGTVLCILDATTGSPCSTGYKPYTGPVVGHVEGVAELLVSFVTVLCTESLVEGEVESAGSATTNPTGKIISLTFGSCNKADICGGSATAQSLNLPWLAEGLGSATTLGNGTLDVTNPRGLFIACGTHCIYTATKAEVEVLGHTATHPNALVDALVTLNRVALDFLCPSTALWHASYSLLPQNLAVHLL